MSLFDDVDYAIQDFLERFDDGIRDLNAWWEQHGPAWLEYMAWGANPGFAIASATGHFPVPPFGLKTYQSLVGENPRADEDSIKALADYWREEAEATREIAGEAIDAATGIHLLWWGDGAPESFAANLSELQAATAGVVTTQMSLAQQVTEFAIQVVQAKMAFRVQVILLAVELVVAFALAIFTLGGSLVAAAARAAGKKGAIKAAMDVFRNKILGTAARSSVTDIPVPSGAGLGPGLGFRNGIAQVGRGIGRELSPTGFHPSQIAGRHAARRIQHQAIQQARQNGADITTLRRLRSGDARAGISDLVSHQLSRRNPAQTANTVRLGAEQRWIQDQVRRAVDNGLTTWGEIGRAALGYGGRSALIYGGTGWVMQEAMTRDRLIEMELGEHYRTHFSGLSAALVGAGLGGAPLAFGTRLPEMMVLGGAGGAAGFMGVQMLQDPNASLEQLLRAGGAATLGDAVGQGAIGGAWERYIGQAGLSNVVAAFGDLKYFLSPDVLGNHLSTLIDDMSAPGEAHFDAPDAAPDAGAPDGHPGGSEADTSHEAGGPAPTPTPGLGTTGGTPAPGSAGGAPGSGPGSTGSTQPGGGQPSGKESTAQPETGQEPVAGPEPDGRADAEATPEREGRAGAEATPEREGRAGAEATPAAEVTPESSTPESQSTAEPTAQPTPESSTPGNDAGNDAHRDSGTRLRVGDVRETAPRHSLPPPNPSDGSAAQIHGTDQLSEGRRESLAQDVRDRAEAQVEAAEKSRTRRFAGALRDALRGAPHQPGGAAARQLTEWSDEQILAAVDRVVEQARDQYDATRWKPVTGGWLLQGTVDEVPLVVAVDDQGLIHTAYHDRFAGDIVVGNELVDAARASGVFGDRDPGIPLSSAKHALGRVLGKLVEDGKAAVDQATGVFTMELSSGSKVAVRWATDDTLPESGHYVGPATYEMTSSGWRQTGEVSVIVSGKVRADPTEAVQDMAHQVAQVLAGMDASVPGPVGDGAATDRSGRTDGGGDARVGDLWQSLRTHQDFPPGERPPAADDAAELLVETLRDRQAGAGSGRNAGGAEVVGVSGDPETGPKVVHFADGSTTAVTLETTPELGDAVVVTPGQWQFDGRQWRQLSATRVQISPAVGGDPAARKQALATRVEEAFDSVYRTRPGSDAPHTVRNRPHVQLLHRLAEAEPLPVTVPQQPPDAPPPTAGPVPTGRPVPVAVGGVEVLVEFTPEPGRSGGPRLRMPTLVEQGQGIRQTKPATVVIPGADSAPAWDDPRVQAALRQLGTLIEGVGRIETGALRLLQNEGTKQLAETVGGALPGSEEPPYLLTDPVPAAADPSAAAGPAGPEAALPGRYLVQLPGATGFAAEAQQVVDALAQAGYGVTEVVDSWSRHQVPGLLVRAVGPGDAGAPVELRLLPEQELISRQELAAAAESGRGSATDLAHRLRTHGGRHPPPGLDQVRPPHETSAGGPAPPRWRPAPPGWEAEPPARSLVVRPGEDPAQALADAGRGELVELVAAPSPDAVAAHRGVADQVAAAVDALDRRLQRGAPAWHVATESLLASASEARAAAVRIQTASQRLAAALERADGQAVAGAYAQWRAAVTDSPAMLDRVRELAELAEAAGVRFEPVDGMVAPPVPSAADLADAARELARERGLRVLLHQAAEDGSVSQTWSTADGDQYGSVYQLDTLLHHAQKVDLSLSELVVPPTADGPVLVVSDPFQDLVRRYQELAEQVRMVATELGFQGFGRDSEAVVVQAKTWAATVEQEAREVLTHRDDAQVRARWDAAARQAPDVLAALRQEERSLRMVDAPLVRTAETLSVPQPRPLGELRLRAEAVAAATGSEVVLEVTGDQGGVERYRLTPPPSSAADPTGPAAGPRAPGTPDGTVRVELADGYATVDRPAVVTELVDRVPEWAMTGLLPGIARADLTPEGAVRVFFAGGRATVQIVPTDRLPAGEARVRPGEVLVSSALPPGAGGGMVAALVLQRALAQMPTVAGGGAPDATAPSGRDPGPDGDSRSEGRNPPAEGPTPGGPEVRPDGRGGDGSGSHAGDADSSGRRRATEVSLTELWRQLPEGAAEADLVAAVQEQVGEQPYGSYLRLFYDPVDAWLEDLAEQKTPHGADDSGDPALLALRDSATQLRAARAALRQAEHALETLPRGTDQATLWHYVRGVERARHELELASDYWRARLQYVEGIHRRTNPYEGIDAESVARQVAQHRTTRVALVVTDATDAQQVHRFDVDGSPVDVATSDEPMQAYRQQLDHLSEPVTSPAELTAQRSTVAEVAEAQAAAVMLGLRLGGLDGTSAPTLDDARAVIRELAETMTANDDDRPGPDARLWWWPDSALPGLEVRLGAGTTVAHLALTVVEQASLVLQGRPAALAESAVLQRRERAGNAVWLAARTLTREAGAEALASELREVAGWSPDQVTAAVVELQRRHPTGVRELLGRSEQRPIGEESSGRLWEVRDAVADSPPAAGAGRPADPSGQLSGDPMRAATLLGVPMETLPHLNELANHLNEQFVALGVDAQLDALELHELLVDKYRNVASTQGHVFTFGDAHQRQFRIKLDLSDPRKVLSAVRPHEQIQSNMGQGHWGRMAGGSRAGQAFLALSPSILRFITWGAVGVSPGWTGRARFGQSMEIRQFAEVSFGVAANRGPAQPTQFQVAFQVSPLEPGGTAAPEAPSTTVGGDGTLLLAVPEIYYQQTGDLTVNDRPTLGPEELPHRMVMELDRKEELLAEVIDVLTESGVTVDDGIRKHLRGQLWSLDSTFSTAVKSRHGYMMPIWHEGEVVAYVRHNLTPLREYARPVGSPTDEFRLEQVGVAHNRIGGTTEIGYGKERKLTANAGDPDVYGGADVEVAGPRTGATTVHHDETAIRVRVDKNRAYNQTYVWQGQRGEPGVRHDLEIFAADGTHLASRQVRGTMVAMMSEADAYRYGLPVAEAAVEREPDGTVRIRGEPRLMEPGGTEQPAFPEFLTKSDGTGLGSGVATVRNFAFDRGSAPADAPTTELGNVLFERLWQELRGTGVLPDADYTPHTLADPADRAVWRRSARALQAQNMQLLERQLTEASLQTRYDQLAQGKIEVVLLRLKPPDPLKPRQSLVNEVEEVTVSLSLEQRVAETGPPKYTMDRDNVHLIIPSGALDSGVSGSRAATVGGNAAVPGLRVGGGYGRPGTASLSVGGRRNSPVRLFDHSPFTDPVREGTPDEHRTWMAVWQVPHSLRVTITSQDREPVDFVLDGSAEVSMPASFLHDTSPVPVAGAELGDGVPVGQRSPAQLGTSPELFDYNTAVLTSVNASGLSELARDQLPPPTVTGTGGPRFALHEGLDAFTSVDMVMAKFGELLTSAGARNDQMFEAGLEEHREYQLGLRAIPGTTDLLGTADVSVTGRFVFGLTSLFSTFSRNPSSTLAGGLLAVFSGEQSWGRSASHVTGRIAGRERLPLNFEKQRRFHFRTNLAYELTLGVNHRSGEPVELRDRWVTWMLSESDAMDAYARGLLKLPESEVSTSLDRWRRGDLELKRTVATAAVRRLVEDTRRPDGSTPHRRLLQHALRQYDASEYQRSRVTRPGRSVDPATGLSALTTLARDHPHAAPADLARRLPEYLRKRRGLGFGAIESMELLHAVERGADGTPTAQLDGEQARRQADDLVRRLVAEVVDGAREPDGDPDRKQVSVVLPGLVGGLDALQRGAGLRAILDKLLDGKDGKLIAASDVPIIGRKSWVERRLPWLATRLNQWPFLTERVEVVAKARIVGEPVVTGDRAGGLEMLTYRYREERSAVGMSRRTGAGVSAGVAMSTGRGWDATVVDNTQRTTIRTQTNWSGVTSVDVPIEVTFEVRRYGPRGRPVHNRLAAWWAGSSSRRPAERSVSLGYNVTLQVPRDVATSPSETVHPDDPYQGYRNLRNLDMLPSRFGVDKFDGQPLREGMYATLVSALGEETAPQLEWAVRQALDDRATSSNLDRMASPVGYDVLGGVHLPSDPTTRVDASVRLRFSVKELRKLPENMGTGIIHRYQWLGPAALGRSRAAPVSGEFNVKVAAFGGVEQAGTGGESWIGQRREMTSKETGSVVELELRYTTEFQVVTYVEDMGLVRVVDPDRTVTRSGKERGYIDLRVYERDLPELRRRLEELEPWDPVTAAGLDGADPAQVADWLAQRERDAPVFDLNQVYAAAAGAPDFDPSLPTPTMAEMVQETSEHGVPLNGLVAFHSHELDVVGRLTEELSQELHALSDRIHESAEAARDPELAQPFHSVASQLTTLFDTWSVIEDLHDATRQLRVAKAELVAAQAAAEQQGSDVADGWPVTVAERNHELALEHWRALAEQLGRAAEQLSEVEQAVNRMTNAHDRPVDRLAHQLANPDRTVLQAVRELASELQAEAKLRIIGADGEPVDYRLAPDGAFYRDESDRGRAADLGSLVRDLPQEERMLGPDQELVRGFDVFDEAVRRRLDLAQWHQRATELGVPLEILLSVRRDAAVAAAARAGADVDQLLVEVDRRGLTAEQRAEMLEAAVDRRERLWHGTQEGFLRALAGAGIDRQGLLSALANDVDLARIYRRARVAGTDPASALASAVADLPARPSYQSDGLRALAPLFGFDTAPADLAAFRHLLRNAGLLTDDRLTDLEAGLLEDLAADLVRQRGLSSGAQRRLLLEADPDWLPAAVELRPAPAPAGAEPAGAQLPLPPEGRERLESTLDWVEDRYYHAAPRGHSPRDRPRLPAGQRALLREALRQWGVPYAAWLAIQLPGARLHGDLRGQDFAAEVDDPNVPSPAQRRYVQEAAATTHWAPPGADGFFHALTAALPEAARQRLAGALAVPVDGLAGALRDDLAGALRAELAQPEQQRPLWSLAPELRSDQQRHEALSALAGDGAVGHPLYGRLADLVAARHGVEVAVVDGAGELATSREGTTTGPGDPPARAELLRTGDHHMPVLRPSAPDVASPPTAPAPAWSDPAGAPAAQHPTRGGSIDEALAGLRRHLGRAPAKAGVVWLGSDAAGPVLSGIGDAAERAAAALSDSWDAIQRAAESAGADAERAELAGAAFERAGDAIAALTDLRTATAALWHAREAQRQAAQQFLATDDEAAASDAAAVLLAAWEEADQALDRFRGVLAGAEQTLLDAGHAVRLVRVSEVLAGDVAPDPVSSSAQAQVTAEVPDQAALTAVAPAVTELVAAQAPVIAHLLGEQYRPDVVRDVVGELLATATVLPDAASPGAVATLTWEVGDRLPRLGLRLGPGVTVADVATAATHEIVHALRGRPERLTAVEARDLEVEAELAAWLFQRTQLAHADARAYLPGSLSTLRELMQGRVPHDDAYADTVAGQSRSAEVVQHAHGGRAHGGDPGVAQRAADASAREIQASHLDEALGEYFAARDGEPVRKVAGEVVGGARITTDLAAGSVVWRVRYLDGREAQVRFAVTDAAESRFAGTDTAGRPVVEVPVLPREARTRRMLTAVHLDGPLVEVHQMATRPEPAGTSMPTPPPFNFAQFRADPRWMVEHMEFERRVGAYYFNDADTVASAREAVRRLREVLEKLHPDASAAEVERAFFRDDPEARRSAGQVGAGVRLDDLLEHGNLRELMTAFYNAAYFNRTQPITLADGVRDVIDGERWLEAAAAGVDTDELRRTQEQLNGWFRVLSSPFAGHRFSRDPLATGNVVMRSENGARNLIEVVSSQMHRRDRTLDEMAQLSLVSTVGDYDAIGAPLGRFERAYLEQLRRGEVTDHDRLPWREGFTAHDATAGVWAHSQRGRGFPVIDGVSGTAARMLVAAKLLGLDASQREGFVKALLGSMLPTRDHSISEVLRGAQLVDPELVPYPRNDSTPMDLYRNLPGLDIGVVRETGVAQLGMLPYERQYLERALSKSGPDLEPSVQRRARKIWDRLNGSEPLARFLPDTNRTEPTTTANWLERHGVDWRDPNAVRRFSNRLSYGHLLALAAFTWDFDSALSSLMSARMWSRTTSPTVLGSVLQRNLEKTARQYLNAVAVGRIVPATPLFLRRFLHLGENPYPRDELQPFAETYVQAVKSGDRRRTADAWQQLRAHLAHQIPAWLERLQLMGDMLHDTMRQLPTIGSSEQPVFAYRGDWEPPIHSFTYGSELYPYVTARSFLSASLEPEVAYVFAANNPSHNRKVVAIYVLTGQYVRDISGLSAVRSEQEVLIPPGARFRRVDNPQPELLERALQEIPAESRNDHDLVVLEEVPRDQR